MAATFAMMAAGGYWAFEARVMADPLREAAIGDHRYCALGLTTGGKEATGITSLAEAARYEPAYHVFESVPGDEIPTSGGEARVLNRHSCVFAGRRFAHVILRYRGAPVSLIVTRGRASSASAAAATHGPSTSTSNGLTVLSFRTADYSVFVVGALSAAELSPLSDAISGDIVHALAAKI